MMSLEGTPGRGDVKTWDSCYQEFMEFTKNPNHDRCKCFTCLLSPDGDGPVSTRIKVGRQRLD